MPASEITAHLPADTRFVALTRVMMASLAAEAGFSVDDIDDLRIAIDEIVGLLMEASDASADLEVRFIVDVDSIAVEVRTAVPVEVDVDPLSKRILAAVTDSFEFAPGVGRMRRTRRPS